MFYNLQGLLKISGIIGFGKFLKWTDIWLVKYFLEVENFEMFLRKFFVEFDIWSEDAQRDSLYYRPYRTEMPWDWCPATNPDLL